jgi:hypothetical protein
METHLLRGLDALKPIVFNDKVPSSRPKLHGTQKEEREAGVHS